jgi:hypothetical protein
MTTTPPATHRTAPRFPFVSFCCFHELFCVPPAPSGRVGALGSLGPRLTCDKSTEVQNVDPKNLRAGQRERIAPRLNEVVEPARCTVSIGDIEYRNTFHHYEMADAKFLACLCISSGSIFRCSGRLQRRRQA